MYFESLQLRLIAHVQDRVQRGELTERGLARSTGISQPHLHNVLKGVRVLSPQIGDVLLRHLHITLLDLLKDDELGDSSLPHCSASVLGLAFRPRTAYPKETPHAREQTGASRGAFRICKKTD